MSKHEVNPKRDAFKLFFRIIVTIFSILTRTIGGLLIFFLYLEVGTYHSWGYTHLMATTLGFAPWGWKVQAVREEQARVRELKHIREQVETDGFYYSQQQIQIRQTSVITEICMLCFKVLLSGFWGIILGWKVCFDMSRNLIDDFRMMVHYWKM